MIRSSSETHSSILLEGEFVGGDGIGEDTSNFALKLIKAVNAHILVLPAIGRQEAPDVQEGLGGKVLAAARTSEIAHTGIVADARSDSTDKGKEMKSYG